MLLDFITFQKFNTKNDAIELIDFLETNHIEYVFEDTSLSYDPTFSNNGLEKEFRIRIKQQDFDKVEELLRSFSDVDIDEVEPSYYLLQFTDEELMEVIAKSDTWSPFDYALALKLLKNRGKDLSAAQIDTLRQQRIKELSQPDNDQKMWIVIGYICAFLGGFFGILMGWHLRSHKKTLPDGSRIFAYSYKDRGHGKNILIIGITVTTFLMGIRFYHFYQLTSLF